MTIATLFLTNIIRGLQNHPNIIMISPYMFGKYEEDLVTTMRLSATAGNPLKPRTLMFRDITIAEDPALHGSEYKFIYDSGQ